MPEGFHPAETHIDWQAHRSAEDVNGIPNSYNNEGNDDGDSASTATWVVIGTLALIAFILIYYALKCASSSPQDREREMNTSRPPTHNDTNPANQVSREQPSRIILVAVCRDGQDDRDQNRPPDGEPPSLGEQDLRNDMSTNPSHELPTYEDATTAEPCPPSYEGMGSTFESDLQPLVDGGKEQDF